MILVTFFSCFFFIKRDEFNQANRTDDIPNVRATLASIVASIPYHISVLLNLKEQTLEEVMYLLNIHYDTWIE